MELLIFAAQSIELRREIGNICDSLNIEYKFSDEVQDWNGFEAVLIGFGSMRKLGDIASTMKSLKMIQSLSAGVDMVDFEHIPNHIVLCSNAGAFSRPVAEHAASMVMALSKRIVPNVEKMKKGDFDQRTQNRNIYGLTMGIVGYGGIGREVGKIAKGIGMKVIAVSRHKGRWDREVIGDLHVLDKLLKKSDVVVLSIPLNKFTRGIINKATLKKMKRNAILINVARAEIIEQEDLYNHLKKNPQFLAGLDVWWKEPMSHGKFQLDFPFLKLNNVLGSPHNSGIVKDQEYVAYQKALENVKKWMIKVEPENQVRIEDYL